MYQTRQHLVSKMDPFIFCFVWLVLVGCFFFFCLCLLDDEISLCHFHILLLLLNDSPLHFLQSAGWCDVPFSIYTFKLGALKLYGLWTNVSLNRRYSHLHDGCIYAPIKRGSKGIHLIKTLYGHTRRIEEGRKGEWPIFPATTTTQDDYDSREYKVRLIYKLRSICLCAVREWASARRQFYTGQEGKKKNGTTRTVRHANIQT